MFVSNTTELAKNSWNEGHKEGVNSVMSSFNDIVYDSPLIFTEEEQKTLRKAYRILDEMFPSE